MSSELYRRMQPFLGDEQELCRRMAGQMDLWEECVRLFPGVEIVEEMDDALQREDFSGFYGTVHRLKGNLANFGFDGAAQLAANTLRAVKEADYAQAKLYYTELKEEYLQVIERIGETDES